MKTCNSSKGTKRKLVLNVPKQQTEKQSLYSRYLQNQEERNVYAKLGLFCEEGGGKFFGLKRL